MLMNISCSSLNFGGLLHAGGEHVEYRAIFSAVMILLLQRIECLK